RIVILDVKTAEKKVLVPALRLPRNGGPKWVELLCWSPDGRRLAWVEHQRDVVVWDVAKGREERVFPAQGGYVQTAGLAWSQDGSRLVAAEAATNNSGTELKVWDVESGNLVSSQRLRSRITRLSWSAQGRIAALLSFPAEPQQQAVY